MLLLNACIITAISNVKIKCNLIYRRQQVHNKIILFIITFTFITILTYKSFQ